MQNIPNLHIQWIEVAWVALTSFLVLIKSINVKDAIVDYKILKRVGLNGFRKTVAKAAVINEFGRLGVSILFLILGLQSFFEEQNYSSNGHVLFMIFLLVCAVLLLWGAFYTTLTRRRLTKMWKSREQELIEAHQKIVALELQAAALATKSAIEQTES